MTNQLYKTCAKCGVHMKYHREDLCEGIQQSMQRRFNEDFRRLNRVDRSKPFMLTMGEFLAYLTIASVVLVMCTGFWFLFNLVESFFR